MTLSAATLKSFLTTHPATIVAELTAVRGSSPREAGTFMLISSDAQVGTIGGGALEYMVIDRARQVLRSGEHEDRLDIPLGPEIGQCCGGRVDVALKRVTEAEATRLIARLDAELAARPHVYLFGAGHVGHALARALAALPLKVHVVDTRPDELTNLPGNVETHAVAMPEAVVRSAPNGSAFVILTHDHALDFLIAAEALQRADAPYVGMVGSKTKKAKFRSWYLGEGYPAARLERLVLPIGGKAFPHGLGDKRPEVIAALAAAEILVHIGWREVEDPKARPATAKKSGAVLGE
ncbi:MAG TPA: xanthine dehydrogenase accessory protein XdhC [Devosia sp.]|jgi:xanthine dehydrogenase accessory factor|uniref:xanthine dehydrogenase accessory protein XdhC n=1 Tax=Devosia sp. TaxID=1871048 RepID=UPI002DDD597E|nr:xanthine dehydrogenase accessory protein XdhC [Devosia sp.]HEV2514752.1 xanthine dehydrogenase accessory protein XdhC [Devosia sp.]